MWWGKKKKMLSLEVSTYDCTGCGACAEKCRRHVFKIVDNGRCRFATVELPGACLACGRCVRACKAEAIELVAIPDGPLL